MKITGYEILSCDAGWRDFSFLRLTTDEGVRGISEFNECYGSIGLGMIIAGLCDELIGTDPFVLERISSLQKQIKQRTRFKSCINDTVVRC